MIHIKVNETGIKVNDTRIKVNDKGQRSMIQG